MIKAGTFNFIGNDLSFFDNNGDSVSMYKPTFLNEDKTKCSVLAFDAVKYSFGVSADFKNTAGQINIIYADSTGIYQVLKSADNLALVLLYVDSWKYNDQWSNLLSSNPDIYYAYAYYGYAVHSIGWVPSYQYQTSFDTFELSPERFEAVSFGNVTRFFDGDFLLPYHGNSFATNFRLEYYELCCKPNFNPILRLLNGS